MRTTPIVSASFEALAESANDAIVTIDEASTILFANPAVERVFGWAPTELIGRSLADLIPERLRDAHRRGILRYLSSGRRNIPWTGVALPGLRRDGTEVPLEISFGEFTDDDGRKIFSGFMRDVSERERQRLELEQARSVAESALQELARVGRVLDLALASSTYEGMLQELLQGLRTEMRADEATIMLLDDRTNELVVEHSDGIHLDRDIRVPLGVGLTGKVAASGSPVYVEDVSNEYVVHPQLRESVVSLLAVPIRSDGRLIGVLHVGTREKRQFTTADLRLLSIVAERVAGVLARTRLYHAERRAREEAERARRDLAANERELRRLNEELERRATEERALRKMAQAVTSAERLDELMQQIANGAVAVSAASGVFVERVVDRDGDVEVVATLGEGTPPVGQRVPYPGSLTEEIIEGRENVFLVRMEGLGAAMAPYVTRECPGCSALVAPLLAGDRVLGALVLLRQPDESPFPEAAVARIRTIADLASLSLQRLTALAESERRRAEAEAAVRSRDEVLSVVSHDLRNPVSTVAMSAALLSDADIRLTPEQVNKQLEVIARSAQRMNRLIQDLLDAARIEGGRFTVSLRCEDPSTIVTETYEAFREIAAKKSLTLEHQVAHDLPRCRVDRDRIVQVLSNLMNNAVKFTSSGGRIAVRATRTPEGGCRFDVADTGAGIDAEQLPNVFNRYWQATRTAHMGTGLGLAIAKGIVDAHHGRIWVESTAGVGSTFSFELPPAPDC